MELFLVLMTIVKMASLNFFCKANLEVGELLTHTFTMRRLYNKFPRNSTNNTGKDYSTVNILKQKQMN